MILLRFAAEGIEMLSGKDWQWVSGTEAAA
jgi:hypothetical protein